MRRERARERLGGREKGRERERSRESLGGRENENEIDWEGERERESE